MFFKQTNHFFKKKSIKHYTKTKLNTKVKTEIEFHVKQECSLKKNIYINLLLNNISKSNSNNIQKNNINSLYFYNNTNMYLTNIIINKKLIKIKQNIYLYLNLLKILKNDLKTLYIYNYYKNYKTFIITNSIFTSVLLKTNEYANILFNFNTNRRIVKFNNNFFFSDSNYIVNKNIFIFQVLKYAINNNINLKFNKINTNFYLLNILFYFFANNIQHEQQVITFSNIINKKKLFNVFKKDNLNKKFIYLLRNKDSNINLKKLIWKKYTNAFNKLSLIKQRKNTSYFTNHKSQNRNVSKSFMYFLDRINEKLFLLKNNKIINKNLIEKLNNLSSYLLLVWNKKIYRQKSRFMFLSTLNKIKTIRHFGWKILFLKALNNLINNKKSLFFNKIYIKIKLLQKNAKINFKKKDKNTFNKTIFDKKLNFFLKRKKWRRILKLRDNWKDTKLMQKHAFSPYKQGKYFLSNLIGAKVSLFFINTLSLWKYSFNLEKDGTLVLSQTETLQKNKKSPKILLQNIEQYLIQRYKYIAIYIQDLIRISFISVFLKNPKFLANFIAFQISKLPKNRKQTSFIRFLIKVIKISASHHKDIIALRIQFKGRVNRWRRTKSIIGKKGIMPLYTYDARIEYGTSKAIIRKGALGIRLWFCYKAIFKKELKHYILSYIDYTKFLQAKAFERFLIKRKNFTKL